MNNPYDIRPIAGELLRFTIQSRSTPDRYLVDLQEWKFNGWCSCRAMETSWNSKKKRWRERFEANGPSDLTRCFHIREVRMWFLDHDVLPIMAAHMLMRVNQIR